MLTSILDDTSHHVYSYYLQTNVLYRAATTAVIKHVFDSGNYIVELYIMDWYYVIYTT